MREWMWKKRKEMGLKQSDVAKAIGSSQELISRAERGLSIQVATAKKIAKVLELDWTMFFDDDPKGE